MKKSDTQPSPDYSLHDRSDLWDLDLPDAPDFISQNTRHGLARMMEFMEEMRAMFPTTERHRQRRRDIRCTDEFVL